jgi:hypothetical protein
MEPDGEWIRDEATSPGGGSGGPGGDGDGGPGGDGRDRGHGGVPGFSVRAAAAVAVLAAAAGVGAGLFLIRGAPAATAAGGATPSASAPAGISTGWLTLPGLPGLSGLPGLPGNGNGQLQMLLTGRVLAVSGTSIAIGGEGASVTAAVTGVTEVTGTVRGIGGVKVGDEVSAQITGTASHLTATAIQDPAANSSRS